MTIINCDIKGNGAWTDPLISRTTIAEIISALTIYTSVLGPLFYYCSMKTCNALASKIAQNPSQMREIIGKKLN